MATGVEFNECEQTRLHVIEMEDGGEMICRKGNVLNNSDFSIRFCEASV